MAPTVGRIVHYHHQFTPAHVESLAAIVTAVSNGSPWLCVFLPAGGTMEIRHAAFSEEPKAGCWSWPPRS